MQIAAIILASGLSERFGQHKAFLPHPFIPDTTFLEAIAIQYQKLGCVEIIVSLNNDNFKLFQQIEVNLPFALKTAIIDKPQLGRFSSIQNSLKVLNHSNSIVFVHNCDNPFADTDLLKEMIQIIRESSYCVPIFKGKGGHPVLISQAIVKQILVSKKFSNFRDVLSNFNRIEVYTDKFEILTNINSEPDYRELLLKYRRG